MITNFQKRVFALVLRIPRGKVTTYGELAFRLKSSPRAVGQALGANPTPVIVPCHRVVNFDGSLGGYLDGQAKKKQLLRHEGICIKKNKIIGFKKILYKF